MSDMFCFQCQQTAGNKCCVSVGVCGKQPDTAALQDELVYELIRLAEAAAAAGQRTQIVDRLLMDGLFITLTNVNFDNQAIAEFTERVRAEREKFGGKPCAVVELWKGDTDTVSLRSTLLFGMKGMAAYAHHARNLGYTDDEVSAWFYKGLCAVNRPHSVEEWLALIVEFGQVNFRCMELLDEANTHIRHAAARKSADRHQKRPVHRGFRARPGRLGAAARADGGKGHQHLHAQRNAARARLSGIEKHPHLAGNFGTAWQSQQTEFENIPAPVLFTTNCLMPQRPSYQDRVYTTSVVGYAGLRHIEADACGRKDFSPIIEQALALGGYEHDHSMSGINGGHMLMTGFAHGAVLAHAEEIISLIKSGKVRHIFLVGGCDGAHPGRNYYTEFVKSTPMDTLVLTLACGKYRFNDLDLGEIGGLPRILDMGQCNDAYSAIKVALALADAFGCTVNDLPLTLVLSWYEQKAVCILLTLLALGVKNIYLGPTLPAFLSETVVKTLVETYDLHPTTNPQQDLDAILGRG